MEIPRSDPLYNFFKDVLKVNMKKGINNRGLYIDGHLVDYTASRKDWPSPLREQFLVKEPVELGQDLKVSETVSLVYREFLEKIGNRYSSVFDDVKGLLLPWFLPADYTVTSDDEGDRFRNDVRAGRCFPAYAYPEDGLFESIQGKMEELLLSLGVVIHYGAKFFSLKDAIGITGSDGVPISQPDGSQYFFCASIVAILKGIDGVLCKELLENKRIFVNALYQLKNGSKKNYSEVLVASARVPSISRISYPLSADDDLAQVEFFMEDFSMAEDLVTVAIEELSCLHGIRVSDIELVEQKQTRTVFFPSEDLQSSVISSVNEWVNDLSGNINIHVRTNSGPINMAKTWTYAVENAKMVI